MSNEIMNVLCAYKLDLYTGIKYLIDYNISLSKNAYIQHIAERYGRNTIILNCKVHHLSDLKSTL